MSPDTGFLFNIWIRNLEVSVFLKIFQLKHAQGPHLGAHTIGNEGSARQHFAEHELDDGQDDADQSADDRHAEQETILRGV